MSIMIRTERRPGWLWWAMGAGVAAVALILIGTLAIPTNGPTPGSGSPEGRLAMDPDGNAIAQAAWDIKVFPTVPGKPSKAQKKAVAKQREPVRETVALVFDGLLLEGDPKVASAALAPGVTAALGSSKLRVPKGMTEVRTLKREATVGIDDKASHGAAKVKIVFEGMLDGKSVTMIQDTTLWLERNGKAWRVIAFDGRMGRRK